MDTVAFRIEPAAFPGGATQQIVPIINDRSLLDLPTRPSATKAGKKRRPAPLGRRHAGLAVHADRAPDLSAFKPSDQPHAVAVLGCTCGDTGCAPVVATVTTDGNAVTWSVAGHRFQFDLKQYERAIMSVERAR